jgi:hypothetical protein
MVKSPRVLDVRTQGELAMAVMVESPRVLRSVSYGALTM